MNDITALAKTLRLAAESEIAHRAEGDTSDLWQDETSPENVLALVEALEKAQRANAAQDDHINQQQDRIDTLEKRNAELGWQLSRYSMSPGQADQRMCESRAARDALGFGKDADNVAPRDLRERIDGMKARITSLESRTVTVTLPAEYLNADGSVNADMANTCPVVSAYREAHRAAGIQVIEGEQRNG
ncbi:hypothetical protein [Kluyvera intermedia]|uniref:Ead/Ea22-like family protein n=1 Tax=Kluyvera intermedia TaxID=61648 RepID=A0AA95G4B0_KLUIN|nr:hypothetical protein [Kluyvera intermedia]WGL57866.1 hypothetical protein QBD33_08975 [Kluyvera intermedia]